MAEPVPVVLFAYARPDLLAQALECLRADGVPLLYVFSDAPRTPDRRDAVESVRALIRAIDWCPTVVTERKENLGLGRSILTGVTEVFRRHDSLIVYEDDLVSVPGAYGWMCAALDHYREEPRVMSVTGWTHPRVTPRDVGDLPYLDRRAECWTWGTWARVWPGMVEDAMTLLRKAEARGTPADAYGSDLPQMAAVEAQKNIWAVRLLYLHLAEGGLCVRPPWSMVEHLGFDPNATNAQFATDWRNPPLRPCPPIPASWPAPVENAGCGQLWREANPPLPPVTIRARLRGLARRVLNSVGMGWGR